MKYLRPMAILGAFYLLKTEAISQNRFYASLIGILLIDIGLSLFIAYQSDSEFSIQRFAKEGISKAAPLIVIAATAIAIYFVMK